MKTWWIGALALAVFATAIPTDADARRFGGGKSSGVQRDMPARTAPDAPPPRPASPTNPANPGQQAAPAAAPAAAGAAAAAQRRSWMGPIAGLAAGLGLAALASYLGFGEAFANFLLLALLAVAAIFLIRFVMRRMAGGTQQPAMAGAGAGAANGTSSTTSARTPWTPPAAAPREDSAPRGAWAPPAAEPPQTVVLPQPAADAAAKAFVPASFDSEGFARIAKSIFIRLQAANDSADLEDLRRFTTPELFAEVRLQLQERGSAPQHTDVQQVDAEVLDVADDGHQQIVSVRFTGRIVEEQDGPAVDFDEVWHLVKPHDDSRSWAIAGIEQMKV